jgi:hypothetical protein
VYNTVKAKVDKTSKAVPYCKVLLLLKEEDFLAVAEKEHKYVQQQYESLLRASNVGPLPSRSLVDAFNQKDSEAQAEFLLKVVQDYEKKWRASLLKAAQSHPNFSGEAIRDDLQATSADYRNGEPQTRKLMVAGQRAEMLNDRGFDDDIVDADFKVKFVEAGCVILHMDYRPSNLELHRLIALVRRHSSMFPWLAAVAVRNSDDAICAIHVLKNIAQDTHSDLVRQSLQKPLVVGNSCMFRVKRRKRGSSGDLVVCAVHRVDGLRSPGSRQETQEATVESPMLIVDALERGHQHIARYYDHVVHQDGIAVDVYTEWCDVSMFSWMVGYTPDFNERVQVCHSICEAVMFLHMYSVAHRGIGPNSIMFRSRADGTMEPVLTRFGSAFKSARMTRGDVSALGDLIVGIFVDHQRHPQDGWTARYRGRRDKIEPLLCKMEQYQLEELCDMFNFIQRGPHDPDEEHEDLPHITVKLLLQHPMLKWPGRNGLNQRVQWMDINKGDLINCPGLARLEQFSGWRQHSDLTPPPCSPRARMASNKLATHATSGQGLIECICHCAKFPDKIRLGLPDTSQVDTAEENDAAARFFLRLFPTLFVALFRDLSNQSGASEADMTNVWELSSVASVSDISNGWQSSEMTSPSNGWQSSEMNSPPLVVSGTHVSRPDGEGDIFEDGPQAIIPARPSGGNSASGVDPASVREAEMARHQGRAKYRESRSEAADGRVAGSS